MATTSTYDQNTTTIERPANKNLYWIIAAAVVLLIALGYAVTPNRSVVDTPVAPPVETTAPATMVPATDPALDPAMNGGATMDTTTVPGSEPMATDPMVTDPMATDPAVTYPETAPAPTQPMTTDER